ncbi:MAG: hypothetical protein ACPG31_11505, partial [Planctomycetota bacterium]
IALQWGQAWWMSLLLSMFLACSAEEAVNQEPTTRLIASIERFRYFRKDESRETEEHSAGWADHATILELEKLLTGERIPHFAIQENGTAHGEVFYGTVFGCRYSDVLQCTLQDGRVVRVLVLCGSNFWRLEKEDWFKLSLTMEHAQSMLEPTRWHQEPLAFASGESLPWDWTILDESDFQSSTRLNAYEMALQLDSIDYFKLALEPRGDRGNDGKPGKGEFVGQATAETLRLIQTMLYYREPTWKLLADGSRVGFDFEQPLLGWFQGQFENGASFRINLYGVNGPWYIEGEGDYRLNDYTERIDRVKVSAMSRIMAPESWE